MLGRATTPINVNNISIVVAGPQVITMITSCCSRLGEVNGVVILIHLPNNYIYSGAEFVFLSFPLPLAGIDPNSGSIPAHAPDSPQETSYDRLHPASASSY